MIKLSVNGSVNSRRAHPLRAFAFGSLVFDAQITLDAQITKFSFPRCSAINTVDYVLKVHLITFFKVCFPQH